VGPLTASLGRFRSLKPNRSGAADPRYNTGRIKLSSKPALRAGGNQPPKGISSCRPAYRRIISRCPRWS